MAKKQYSYYIGVITEDGLKFVTSLHPTEKYARWEAGKEAKEFNMSVADSIVYGLLLNFHYAFTVKVPNGIKFHNPKKEGVSDNE